MGHARALLGTPDRAFQETAGQAGRSSDDLRCGGRGGDPRARRPVTRARHRMPMPTRSAEPRRRLRPPGLVELEELLGDHLDTRVKITHGRGGAARSWSSSRPSRTSSGSTG